MKERPILFSGPMVRAILEGRKTVTRRVVKPQPMVSDEEAMVLPEAWAAGFVGVKCPHGRKGDRLWVRETWASPDQDKSKQGRVAYDADGVCGCWCGHGEDRSFMYHGRILQASGFSECFPKSGSTTFGLGKYTDVQSGEYPSYKYGWRPSIHMPRWASRLTLELTEVRVERLQDITEADARAEGIQVLPMQSSDDPSAWWQSSPGVHQDRTARGSFIQLWDSINAKKHPWESNPWVWVESFRKVN